MIGWNSKKEAEALADDLLKPVPHDEFARKIADKRFNYYAALASRHGAGTLASSVEYRLFHPVIGPNSNDDFLFMVVHFDEIPFIVFGVPARFEATVQQYADVLLMRIADALPVLIGPDGPQKFPGWDAATEGRLNLFTIENTSGSQVYLNRRDLNKALRERENKIVDVLMQYGPQVPLEMIRDYLWLGEISSSQA